MRENLDPGNCQEWSDFQLCGLVASSGRVSKLVPFERWRFALSTWTAKANFRTPSESAESKPSGGANIYCEDQSRLELARQRRWIDLPYGRLARARLTLSPRHTISGNGPFSRYRSQVSQCGDAG